MVPVHNYTFPVATTNCPAFLGGGGEEGVLACHLGYLLAISIIFWGGVVSKPFLGIWFPLHGPVLRSRMTFLENGSGSDLFKKRLRLHV